MLSTGRDAPGAYRSTTHGILQLWRTEGLQGFYRGLLPSLFGVSHGAVQFMAYEQLKHYRGSQVGGRSQLSNWDYLYLSALSKVFAGSITYPYQVVRARLQTYDHERSHRSARHVMAQVWRDEGITGFYKGYVIAPACSREFTKQASAQCWLLAYPSAARLVPNIIRVLPSTCVTFLVYENAKFYLPRLYAGQRTHELE